MTDHEDTHAETEESETGDAPLADQQADDDSATGNETTGEAGAVDSAGEKVISAVQWGAFAILILVALIATLRFYFSASNAINEFVTRQYRPLFQAVFNLIILLASVLGLSVLARRIT